jgi:hypothetical protein
MDGGIGKGEVSASAPQLSRVRTSLFGGLALVCFGAWFAFSATVLNVLSTAGVAPNVCTPAPDFREIAGRWGSLQVYPRLCSASARADLATGCVRSVQKAPCYGSSQSLDAGRIRWQERFDRSPQRIWKQRGGHTCSRYFADEEQVSEVFLYAALRANMETLVVGRHRTQTAARPSISIFAPASSSAFTSTSVIAG